MKIRIHRGTHQIGGCVTEYEHEGWRLFVDYGEPLPGEDKTDLHIEGLTYGDLSKSALLITHYHGDHVGRITKLPDELPIYIGKIGREIQQVLSNHLKSVDKRHELMLEKLERANTFNSGESFAIGPFTIMPVTVDHSAFDAYAFKIEADGVKAFHTGDFRTHGFRSKKFPKLLETYIGEVDYLVCEATNVRQPDKTNLSERVIQRNFESRFRENKGNIVYLSSTNIDRLFALYHAALKAGRPFLVDQYQKQVMDIIVNSDPIWGKAELYQYGKYEPKVLIQENNEFTVNDAFIDFLNLKGFVLIARADQKFDNLIEKLPGEKKKYLSMWEGYVKEGVAYNKDLEKSLGDDYEYIHTSGHCDMESLKKVAEQLNPKAIIPIHTDDPDGFVKYFSDEWPVLQLNDGEVFSPISSSQTDACTATIFFAVNPGEEIKRIDGDEKFWGLAEKGVGTFANRTDAFFALSHTTYKLDCLLGFQIEDEEDMTPSVSEIYDSKLSLLATYTEGEHQPGGKNYHEACRFAPGEKVLALFTHTYYAVVPAIVSRPVTKDDYREKIENDPIASSFYDDYEDFIASLYDWDWDSMVVNPLVKLSNGFDEMTDKEIVPRVYLFPYREF